MPALITWQCTSWIHATATNTRSRSGVSWRGRLLAGHGRGKPRRRDEQHDRNGAEAGAGPQRRFIASEIFRDQRDHQRTEAVGEQIGAVEHAIALTVAEHAEIAGS